MMGMVQNGYFAMTVALGTIGVVLFPCLPVTLNSNSPSNVPPKVVGSNNIKRDFSSKTSPKLDLHLDIKRDKNYDPVFLLRMGPKVKYSNKGWKKVKRTPAQSHYKKKNLLYPAKKWDQAFELRVRNASLAQGEAKWTLERISTKTGIPKSTLGHHFDEKKTTRKGRGHIAGGHCQSKVLSKGKWDFLTVLATETWVIGKWDQCLTCFLDLILPLIVIEMEQELATVVYQFCERDFPFTGKRLKKLAYELAVANKRKGFSPKKKILA